MTQPITQSDLYGKLSEYDRRIAELERAILLKTFVDSAQGTDGIVSVFGPLVTPTCAAIAASGEEVVTHTHNLALTANQTANAVIAGHLEDGFFSSLVSWRVQTISTDDVTIGMGNGSSRTDTQAKLRYWIITRS